jgi:hypothetical protein
MLGDIFYGDADRFSMQTIAEKLAVRYERIWRDVVKTPCKPPRQSNRQAASRPTRKQRATPP